MKLMAHEAQSLFLVYQQTQATKMLTHVGTEMEVRVEEFTQVNEI